MRSNFQLLLLLCSIALPPHAQNDQPPSLNIGDPAPPLQLRAWLKGEPIQQFKKGNVYVVEFWATWCHACIAASPHLSALAGEYHNKVTILGIDVQETKITSLEDIKAFVDSMGNRMDYRVATEDRNFMEAGWLQASGEQGIPTSFVVNAEGRVVWIGPPKKLAEVLSKITNNTWDIKAALVKRNSEKHLEETDAEAAYNLYPYSGSAAKPDDLGKPDSALLLINEMVRNEPRLKYAPVIASYTFSSLLKTNPHEAYKYGRELLSTTEDDPLYYVIFLNIDSYSDRLNLPAEIYQLGAEAYRARIEASPETADLPNFYHKMAMFYWRANDKTNSIAAEEKAIEALKSEKDYSQTDLTEFEFRLQQYQNK